MVKVFSTFLFIILNVNKLLSQNTNNINYFTPCFCKSFYYLQFRQTTVTYFQNPYKTRRCFAGISKMSCLSFF